MRDRIAGQRCTGKPLQMAVDGVLGTTEARQFVGFPGQSGSRPSRPSGQLFDRTETSGARLIGAIVARPLLAKGLPLANALGELCGDGMRRREFLAGGLSVAAAVSGAAAQPA